MRVGDSVTTESLSGAFGPLGGDNVYYGNTDNDRNTIVNTNTNTHANTKRYKWAACESV